MNPNGLSSLLQPLEVALASMSPQDWGQVACVALLSWLGGRAIVGPQEAQGEAPRRVSIQEATRYNRRGR